MSQENVEIVRVVHDAFAAGVERGELGAAWETGAVATDAELRLAPEVPGGQMTYRGREGFIEAMKMWTENFERWSVRLEQLVDAPDDRVVAFVHQEAVGMGSGVPVDLHYGAVFELEGGRVIRTSLYLERAQALEAAGLRE